VSDSPHQAVISKRPRFKRRGSILLTLVVVLTVVGLAPMVFVAARLIEHNREALTTVQQQSQILFGSSIARELDTYVDGLRSEIVRMTYAVGAVAAHAEAARSEEIRGILDDVTDGRMLCLHYSDLKGASVESRSDLMTGEPPDRLFRRGFSAAAEMLADTSASGRTAWISPPFITGAAPGRAALVLAAPVVSGGSFRGVLSVVADLQIAWDGFQERKSEYTVFALDPSGSIFATNNAAMVPLDADLSESSLVQTFIDQSRRDEGPVGPFHWRRNGREEEFIGTWLKTRQGWGVFVQAPSHDMYWSVRHMIHTTQMWAAVALGVALLIAVFMARRISRPIRGLASASRRFASGDFTTRVPIPTRNEIGELADTFNLMASEIEEYIRELEELFTGTINALTAAIDAKDPYTRGHSERVNAYAVILARHMSLTKEQEREINFASRLHDVGKIAVRDSVLGKQGPLTAEEFTEMKNHTVRGEAIMAPIRQMRSILPGLRNHHERWQGGGYPDGLAGEDIPLMARIIAVADTFDATTTERPYQKAMTFEQAKNRINELKGVGLDPLVVEAFNRAFDAGEFREVPRETAAPAVTA